MATKQFRPRANLTTKQGLSLGSVPAVNSAGHPYPRWHAKHPANAIVVSASVAPTKAPGT
jgi:hypothetical protein